MNFADEPYVRVFKRDTANWLALSFIAQGLFLQLLRKVDRAGLLSLGKLGRRAVAVVIGHAGDWPRLEPGLDELLEDGCVEIKGDLLVIPNFLEAQESVMSGKLRTHEWRERKKTEALSGDATSPGRDETSTRGDGASPNVTCGDAARRTVTRCDPSFLPSEPSKDGASPESSATPTPPLKAKKAKKAESTVPVPVEALRLRLVAFIRSQGTPYVENVPGERKKLKDALSAPGVTEATVEAAFRELYARGKRPGVLEVGWVLRAASERPTGRNGAPRPIGSELRDFVGFDDEGQAVYRDGGKP